MVFLEQRRNQSAIRLDKYTVDVTNRAAWDDRSHCADIRQKFTQDQVAELQARFALLGRQLMDGPHGLRTFGPVFELSSVPNKFPQSKLSRLELTLPNQLLGEGRTLREILPVFTLQGILELAECFPQREELISFLAEIMNGLPFIVSTHVGEREPKEISIHVFTPLNNG